MCSRQNQSCSSYTQVDPGHIEAKVENGVLRVIVPKTEKHEQHSTDVNVE